VHIRPIHPAAIYPRPMAIARVGVSGWRYPGWRGVFYPEGLQQRRELEYAGEHLTSIEINGTFYSLQRASSFATWRDETPDDFVFTVKGSRFITHMKRLIGGAELLPNFLASGMLGLGPKLGPILWQLPPNFAFDAQRLGTFFADLPRTTFEAAAIAARHDDRLADDHALTTCEVDLPLRYALEVRHPSFATDEALELCRTHGVAMVVADTGGKWPEITETTADFVYARLHGPEELYASGYTPEGLDAWANRVGGWLDSGRDVFMYFDNDLKAFAPRDAMGMIERLRARTG